MQYSQNAFFVEFKGEGLPEAFGGKNILHIDPEAEIKNNSYVFCIHEGKAIIKTGEEIKNGIEGDIVGRITSAGEIFDDELLKAKWNRKESKV